MRSEYFSANSFASDFGKISPKIKMMTVVTNVDTRRPVPPLKIDVAMAVDTVAEPMLTILFPTRIVESVSSKRSTRLRTRFAALSPSSAIRIIRTRFTLESAVSADEKNADNMTRTTYRIKLDEGTGSTLASHSVSA